MLYFYIIDITHSDSYFTLKPLVEITHLISVINSNSFRFVISIINFIIYIQDIVYMQYRVTGGHCMSLDCELKPEYPIETHQADKNIHQGL